MSATPDVCQQITHAKDYGAHIGMERAKNALSYGFLFKVFLSLSGICLGAIVLFYVGYKCVLRQKLKEEVGDRMNDTLSKYYTDGEMGNSGYLGAKFDKAEKGDPNDYGIE